VVTRIKVNSKNQIAVPAGVRRKLGIKSGDHLLVDIRGDHIVLIPEPKDYSDHLHGLHHEIWEGVEPQEFIRQERAEWRNAPP
jgi:AbrB family looped-hinge helix DNA binding protein